MATPPPPKAPDPVESKPNVVIQLFNDPQLNSAFTSILLALATGAAGWFVHQGFIPDADQSVIVSVIVAIVSLVAAVAIGWYKTHKVSPTALIKAVNDGDNGVRVVSALAATSTAPTVTAPLKGKA